MEKTILKAELRGTGRHANREIRDAERVPGVVYGQGVLAQPVSLSRKELGAALHASGGGLLELSIPGQSDLHVLVREVQRHPTKRFVQHVDLYAVSMTQKVRVGVTIAQEGTAPVLSNPDMVLVRKLDSVEIECLPGDIPEHLTADLSRLASVDDEILVRDLRLPPNVKVLTDADHVTFSVTMSRAAAVDEAAEPEEASPAEVELVSKRKPKEGEEQ